MTNRVHDEIITRKMMPFYLEVVFTLCTLVYIGCVWYIFFCKPLLYELFSIIAIVAFFVVVKFFTNVIYFRLNLTKKTYQKTYGLGFLKFNGKWKPLPTVEYVSVFCQLVEGPDDDEGINYDVNLWYEGNKHYTVYSDYFSESAFRLARTIANNFEVGLLDATSDDPDDYAWIDLKGKNN